jgi:DNA modification methylase
MILRFPQVSFPGLAHAQAHAYEKPQALCEMLLRKHSRASDLVFDACGCTGSMSLAAINCGRRWVYAESHQDNFRLGERRIATAVAKATPLAS